MEMVTECRLTQRDKAVKRVSRDLVVQGRYCDALILWTLSVCRDVCSNNERKM